VVTDLTIHKAKDNSFKLILSEHELFVEFLRDFIKIDMLNDVQPADVEDVTERFLPLFQDNKDSDTVKRINLKGNIPLFVIAIVEHESQVNHRASFKMLQYITLVLADYEKEANKAKEGISKTKEFKFPPVLPIIFYDGPGNWTAATDFLDKTELNQVFHKYIPKFEYELVNLNQYSQSDLAEFGDTLSLIMIIDKIRTPDGISLLGKLPPDYVGQLALNIPEHLNKLIADVITILLSRINVPKQEINAVTEKIYQRRLQEMFTFIEDYDVQEARRVFRQEGIQEGIQKGRQEAIQESRQEAVRNMKKESLSDETIARILNISVEEVRALSH
jgi:predicted transposase/invertase (TIGR01784 family)